MPSPITVNVNFIDLTGNTVQGYMQAVIQSPTGVYDLYVAGLGILAPKISTSATGTSASVSIWGNDVVVDNADSALDTYYIVTLYNTSNIPIWSAPYSFTGNGPINLVGYPSLTTIPTPSGSVPTNILTSNNIFTGTNSFTNSVFFTGNNTHSGAETFANINNCFTVDGTTYTTIQAAITAAPAGGNVCIPAGAYAPTSTISITKALTIQGPSSGAAIITPTNAVTGAAIAVNPAVSSQVVIRNLQINMVNVPTIPAITANNMGANSEIGWVVINLGTIGIDITNSGVCKFHDLYITNQTSFGIRDNADGGAEHHYDSVWLINNNNTVNTTALYEYIRTTSTDTGGLYMNNVRAIRNTLGGTVTNGFLITSSAGSRTIIHGFLTDTITDGIFAGDAVLLNNVSRVSVNGGQWGNGAVNASCAAATVSCQAAVSLTGAAQVTFGQTWNGNSNNRDISLSGSIDRVEVLGSGLFGAAAVGAAHIWVVTGATLTNLTVFNPNYDTTTVYSNNEAALIAATPSQVYGNAGKIGLADGGVCSTPSWFFNAETTTGIARVAGSTVAFCTALGGQAAKYSNTGWSFVVPPVPSIAGATDLGSTSLPFGNLWFGTLGTNNFKLQPASTTGARIITVADPLSPTTVALPMTIANGTAAMTTAAIAAGACGTTVTVAATGVLTTDVIDVSHNAAATAANGGINIINSWPTAGNVNFNYCTSTANTPTAMTINWSVRRP